MDSPEERMLEVLKEIRDTLDELKKPSKRNDLVERMGSHLMQMAPHQRARQQGQLLFEAWKRLKEIDK